MTSFSEKSERHDVHLSFEEAFAQVKEQVFNRLSRSPKIIREMTGHLTASQGKYIRTSALLTCAMDENDLIHPDAVSLSAAIELLHLATLVHDDVIDDSPLRRGVMTLQKKFGKRMAVVCGDYLLSLSLRLAAESGRQDRDCNYDRLDLPGYMSRLCLGELNQNLNNGNLRLSAYRYLKIISGKTAALFEATFLGGAVICGASEKQIDCYKKIGRYVGMMFQITDDCNDFTLEKTAAAKPVQSDFEQGVVTLPLIYTLSRQPELRQQLDEGALDSAQLNQRVAGGGGLQFSRGINKRYHQKALKMLDKLDLTPQKRMRLEALIEKSGNWR